MGTGIHSQAASPSETLSFTLPSSAEVPFRAVCSCSPPPELSPSVPHPLSLPRMTFPQRGLLASNLTDHRVGDLRWCPPTGTSVTKEHCPCAIQRGGCQLYRLHLACVSVEWNCLFCLTLVNYRLNQHSCAVFTCLGLYTLGAPVGRVDAVVASVHSILHPFLCACPIPGEGATSPCLHQGAMRTGTI